MFYSTRKKPLSFIAVELCQTAEVCFLCVHVSQFINTAGFLLQRIMSVQIFPLTALSVLPKYLTFFSEWEQFTRPKSRIFNYMRHVEEPHRKVLSVVLNFVSRCWHVNGPVVSEYMNILSAECKPTVSMINNCLWFLFNNFKSFFGQNCQM